MNLKKLVQVATKLSPILTIVFLLGCEQVPANAPASQSPPVLLVAAERVVLEDRDSAYIGKANALAVSRSGEVFVTDISSNRVLHFGRNGNFIEALGRQGSGPNEFEGPGLLTSVNDTLLLITDHSRRDAVLWNLKANSAVQRIPLPGAPGRFATANGSLFVGSPDVSKSTIGLKWTIPASQPQYLGKISSAYRSRLAAVWGHVAVTAYGDTIAYYNGKSDYLVLADSTWSAVDSIFVPRRIRRGIPAKLDTILGGGRNIYFIMNQVSVPMQIDRLSGGRFAVTHLDASVTNNLVSGAIFVTVVSAAHRSSCVDMVIPMHDSGTVARVSYVGDTLYVLDHFIEKTEAIAELSKYVISGSLCG